MLDIHPAHAPAHSWRDFFIHLATITIGLPVTNRLNATESPFRLRLSVN